MFHPFRNVSFALASCLFFLPLPVLGASIFVNGTQVDGALSSYKLEKCTANFDARGDLHLDCPGYNFKIETEEGTAPTPAQQAAIRPKPGSQYVLFSSQSQIGATGFDVDVFINGALAVRLKNEDVQIVEEVTRHLHKGENTITFVARKKPSIRHVKASPSDHYEIQISEGSFDPVSNSLTIKAGTGIEYRITAAETVDNTKELKLVVR